MILLSVSVAMNLLILNLQVAKNPVFDLSLSIEKRNKVFEMMYLSSL